MLGVALLAGFLFIGGGAALYLSTPQASPDATAVSVLPTPTRSLDVFVQETVLPSPTPVPTPAPAFSFDLGSPSPDLLSPTPTLVAVTPTPTPTDKVTPRPDRTPRPTPRPTREPTPTPRPTRPATPTPTPTPAPTATAPRANFTAAQQSGLTVKFNDTSKGVVTARSWDFGDGTDSSRANPSHEYDAAGTYTVTLTITGPGGADSRSKQVTVAAEPEGPTANFDCNNSVPLQLTCTAVEDGATYTWESNGQTGTDKSVTFQYESEGLVDVTLTVTKDNLSESKTESHAVLGPELEGPSGVRE